MRLRTALVGLAALSVSAQAPLLQDGAAALWQARRAWIAGEPPLPPLAIPSLEVGLGGADSDGLYTPLTEGEGSGHGIRGWGLGLQGRYVQGGWTVSATAFGLRQEGRTLGILHRAALAYQWESGWRLALEQGPTAWGVGLNGGDLLGAASRSFPRLSLATPAVTLPFGTWRVETFLGWLEGDRPIPAWAPDREARVAAQAAGRDLRRPELSGGMVRGSFGAMAEVGFGILTLSGGHDALGQPAPTHAARTSSLVDLKVRVPALARLMRAQGAALYLGRSAAPEGQSIALEPSRTLGGLQVVWEGWDVGLEYAAAAETPFPPLAQPAYLAGESVAGDPLGPAFGRTAVTRTVELGMPLFLEGQGRLKVARATYALSTFSGAGTWFLQGEAQWRTSTGRIGASVASRRNDIPGSAPRWGWTFAVFQAFRVF